MTRINNSCKYFLAKLSALKYLQLDLCTFDISTHHLTFLIQFQVFNNPVLSFLKKSYITLVAERCSRIVTATVYTLRDE